MQYTKFVMDFKKLVNFRAEKNPIFYKVYLVRGLFLNRKSKLMCIIIIFRKILLYLCVFHVFTTWHSILGECFLLVRVVHIFIAPGFKPPLGYARRVFHPSFGLITFGGRYHVHKSLQQRHWLRNAEN